MSVLLTRRKRAGTDPEEAAEDEGLKYLVFDLEGSESKIYVTAKRHADDLEKMLSAAEANVFDAAAEYGKEGDLYKALADKLTIFAARIEAARKSGKHVILHCLEGRARSIICLGIYLMQHHGCSYADAMARINAAFLAAKGGGRAYADKPGLRVERVLMMYEASFVKEKPQNAERRRSKRGKTTE